MERARDSLCVRANACETQGALEQRRPPRLCSVRVRPACVGARGPKPGGLWTQAAGSGDCGGRRQRAAREPCTAHGGRGGGGRRAAALPRPPGDRSRRRSLAPGALAAWAAVAVASSTPAASRPGIRGERALRYLPLPPQRSWSPPAAAHGRGSRARAIAGAQAEHDRPAPRRCHGRAHRSARRRSGRVRDRIGALSVVRAYRATCTRVELRVRVTSGVCTRAKRHRNRSDMPKSDLETRPVR